jgi:tRNA-dihydrouridine synthase 3
METRSSHRKKAILPGDSAVTRAEKVERKRSFENLGGLDGTVDEEASDKRVKLDREDASTAAEKPENGATERQRGVAPIKKEYLVDVTQMAQPIAHADDDEAEAAGKSEPAPQGGRGGQKTKGGQNHNRHFGSSRDTLQLCKSRKLANLLDPVTCGFGEKCRFEHDIQKYLKEGKREDLTTFEGTCPVFQVKGVCNAGWSCRFAGSHSKAVKHEDGRDDMAQIRNQIDASADANGEDEESGIGVANAIDVSHKLTLRKKKFPTPKADKYLGWLNSLPADWQAQKRETQEKLDHRAAYGEPPLRPSEKRRIYYGPETPVLAPLTTQGNLPFRRLCVSLGAQITWSEMAMGLPLLQGEKQEWALMKAHESEITPPAYSPKTVVHDYNNSKDIRFGAQIAANKPWLALKTTEVLTTLCPHLRAIDLNCGCPIDLVCRQGAGSALLDKTGQLEKILRGMNTVSNDVPITVKIRMGTRDKQPTADKLIRKLILGSEEAQDATLGPAGVAAITLHGRSKQQRYSRSANWEYIAQCANLIKNLRDEQADVMDTVREPDDRDLPVTNGKSGPGVPYFVGNGDVLSHVDYAEHMANAGVDTCMVGRGALIKPWIFEEISTNQYLDKSASERLGYIEQFARNGLEYWGSDEIGVGITRRFLLEWLSFSCRYVPIGLLEYLPPKFGDRPPAYKGRNDLETLLASANYKDWIKLR